jgi:cephalosporin-C deacetylase-like acetyl esterase
MYQGTTMFRLRAALLASAAILITAPIQAQAPALAVNPAQAGRAALTAYLNNLAFHETAARRATIARIHTRAQAQARQRAVRAKILALFGALPARIPLNTRITGSTTLPDGIRVDKLLFDSQPNFPITALLYTPAPPAPAAATSPSCPAIIMAPGHSPAGKAGDVLFATVFARAGFVVLSYDPIGQGERLQYLDPASPLNKPVSFAGKPTGEHGEAGLQPTLLGDSLARYFLWDGMRAVDLLQSLPNVDPHRIGAFGCSGGGTMTAMLAALDPRIAAAGVACYTTSWDALLPSATGVQDTEQSTANFISSGLDFPDWSESFAPNPYAIIATTADMFPFAGAQATYTEASRFYSLFNASANLAFITGPGGHGNLRPILPQILAFFTTHLHPNAYYEKNLPPVTDPFLPKKNLSSRPEPAPLAGVAERPAGARPEPPPLSLTQVTPTGQLSSSYPNIATVFTLNEARAATITTPHPQTLAALQQAVRRVTRAEAIPGKTTGSPLNIQDAGVETLGSQGALSVRYSVRDNARHPAVLLLTESQPLAATEVNARINAQPSTGLFILTPRPAPPGTEETKSPLLGPFYITGLRAQLVGKTLLGMRVDDVIHAIDYLTSRSDVDSNQISVETTDSHLALVLLHAAILDPRIRHVTVDNFLPSYRTLTTQPLPKDAPQDMLPGVLRQYDIPDLVRLLGSKLTFPPR